MACTCVKCDKKFKNRRNLESHMKGFHHEFNYEPFVENKFENTELDIMKKLLVETNQLITSTVMSRGNQMHISKTQKVPNWIREQSLESFCNQLRTWNKSSYAPDASKFYDVIETLKTNKEIPGLKDFVSNQIMNEIEPETINVVEKIINVIEEKYKKHPLEKITEILLEFVKFRQEDDESPQDCQERYTKLFEAAKRNKVFVNFEKFFFLQFMQNTKIDEHQKVTLFRELKGESNDGFFEKGMNIYKEFTIECNRKDDVDILFARSRYGNYNMNKRNNSFYKNDSSSRRQSKSYSGSRGSRASRSRSLNRNYDPRWNEKRQDYYRNDRSSNIEARENDLKKREQILRKREESLNNKDGKKMTCKNDCCRNNNNNVHYFCSAERPVKQGFEFSEEMVFEKEYTNVYFTKNDNDNFSMTLDTGAPCNVGNKNDNSDCLRKLSKIENGKVPLLVLID